MPTCGALAVPCVVVAVADAAAVFRAALAAPGQRLERQRLLLVEAPAPGADCQAAQLQHPGSVIPLAAVATRGGGGILFVCRPRMLVLHDGALGVQEQLLVLHAVAAAAGIKALRRRNFHM